MRDIQRVRVLAWKKPRKSALLLCRDHRLNESLRVLWEKDGWASHVVNTAPDALIWFERNRRFQPDDFSIVLVTLNGRGREYWQIFLGTVDSEYLPAVEVDL